MVMEKKIPPAAVLDSPLSVTMVTTRNEEIRMKEGRGLADEGMRGHVQ